MKFGKATKGKGRPAATKRSLPAEAPARPSSTPMRRRGAKLARPEHMEVFVYVRLNALVRLDVRHDDVEEAKEAAKGFCESIGDEMDLLSIERLRATPNPGGDIEIGEAEILEITQGYDAFGPQPKIFGVKVRGRFADLAPGADVETLPKDCR